MLDLQAVTIALVRPDSDDPRHIEPSTETTISPYCAGVWVSYYQILTAAHCVDEPANPLLKELGIVPFINPIGQRFGFVTTHDIEPGQEPFATRARRVRWATVRVFRSDIDLALLEVDRGHIPPNHPVVLVGRGTVRLGTQVHVMGHTSGMWWCYTSGWISSDRTMRGPFQAPNHVLQVSAPIWSGNSGGGAFDQAGSLVGIASFMRPSVPSMGFFVHRNVILTFLIDNGVLDP